MTNKAFCTCVRRAREEDLAQTEVRRATPGVQPEIEFDVPPSGQLIKPPAVRQLRGLLREHTLLHWQSTIGNHAVQRAIDRSSSSAAAIDDLAQRIRAASIGGRPIDTSARERLEASLNADLSAVKIHTDDEAVHLSQALDARAFATGQHIFFQQGQYQPNTVEGLHLLAHEATHILQQASEQIAGESVGDSVSISEPTDSRERAADRIADQIVLESPASSRHTHMSSPVINSTWSIAVQREEAGAEEDPILKTLGSVLNPFSVVGGEKLFEHLAEAPKAASWLGPASGAVPLIGGALEMWNAVNGEGENTAMRWAKGASGASEFVGGGAKMLSSVIGEGAPGMLTTMGKWLPGAGAALGAGLWGLDVGSWLYNNTSARETAIGTWETSDKMATKAWQDLGLMEEGKNKSLMTGPLPDNPALLPVYAMTLGSAGMAAGMKGTASGVADVVSGAGDRTLDMLRRPLSENPPTWPLNMMWQAVEGLGK